MLIEKKKPRMMERGVKHDWVCLFYLVLFVYVCICLVTYVYIRRLEEDIGCFTLSSSHLPSPLFDAVNSSSFQL